MKFQKVVKNATQVVVSKIDQLMPFGKFERFTAGFCMAIPFFLLTANETAGKTVPMFIVSVIITILPLAIPLLVQFTKNPKNYGMVIMTAGGILLFGLYKLFIDLFQVEDMGSISAYVLMDNSHVFGMLLAIAAMLFIVNGAVYWNKKEFAEGEWRSLLNVGLGIFLLLVVIFRCDKTPTIHLVVAGIFFLLCAWGTIRRPAKKEKRGQQRFFDFAPVTVMTIGMIGHFGHSSLDFWPFNLFNLFGAESIALWITGLDFILVSLKKEIDPLPVLRSLTRARIDPRDGKKDERQVSASKEPG